MFADPYKGLLQPDADQRGQRVVHHQQENGVGMVIPGQLWIYYDLPGAGAVCLNNRFDSKQPVQKQRSVDSCSQPWQVSTLESRHKATHYIIYTEIYTIHASLDK